MGRKNSLCGILIVGVLMMAFASNENIDIMELTTAI